MGTGSDKKPDQTDDLIVWDDSLGQGLSESLFIMVLPPAVFGIRQ